MRTSGWEDFHQLEKGFIDRLRSDKYTTVCKSHQRPQILLLYKRRFIVLVLSPVNKTAVPGNTVPDMFGVQNNTFVTNLLLEDKD